MNKWISGLLTATLILCPVTGCTALGAFEEAVNQNQQVKSAVNNKSTAQVPLTSRAGAAQNTADPLNFANENALREVLVGQWVYCPPASSEPALWISFMQ